MANTPHNSSGVVTMTHICVCCCTYRHWWSDFPPQGYTSWRSNWSCTAAVETSLSHWSQGHWKCWSICSCTPPSRWWDFGRLMVVTLRPPTPLTPPPPLPYSVMALSPTLCPSHSLSLWCLSWMAVTISSYHLWRHQKYPPLGGSCQKSNRISWRISQSRT